MTERELRQIVMESGIKLLENNLVQGTWGNSSVRLDDKYMLVTPSGLDYAALKPGDVVKVEIENPKKREGGLKPTSEKGIHAAVYKSRPEVGAIIHTHSVYGSVFASARKSLPCKDEEMRALIGGDVETASYGLPSTKKLRIATVNALGKKNAVFMANHGVLCVGKTMDEAFEVIKFVENACREFIEKKTLELTGETEFTEDLLNDCFLSSNE